METTSTPTEKTTIVRCRVCYSAMQIDPLPVFGYDIVTCTNPFCPMCHHTFDVPSYKDVDLAKYGAWEYDPNAPFEEEEVPEPPCDCRECRGDYERPAEYRSVDAGWW